MKNYKLLKEHDSHYEVQNCDTGSSFKVAKKGLSKRLQAQVSGLQHFAEGGEVQPVDYLQGGTADFSTANGFPDGAPDLSTIPVNAPDGYTTPQVEAPANESVSLYPAPFQPSMTLEQAQQLPPAPASPPAPAPAQAQASGPVPQESQSAPALPTMPAFPSAPAPVSAAGLTRAIQGQKDALYRAADVEAQKGSQEQSINEQLQIAEAQRQKDEQAAQDQERARGDAFRDAYAKGKVDPSHYWNSMSTEGKIGTLLALAIGGYVSGKNHTPNYALQAVNENVDKDLAEQQRQIEKNRDLAGMSDQERARISTEFARRKVDMLTLARIKLDTTAARFSGPKAQAGAAQLAAGLDGEIAKAQMSVASQNANSAFAYKMQKLNYELQNRQSLAQQGAAGTLQQMYSGKEFDPGLQAMLPEKDRERAVNMPNGNQRLAVSSKGADTYREVQEATSRIQDLVREARQLGATGVGTKASARAKQIQAEMQTEWGKIAGLARYTELEDKKYEDIIGNIGAWNQDRQNARLDGVQHTLDTVRDATNRNLLLGGGPAKAANGGLNVKTSGDY